MQKNSNKKIIMLCMNNLLKYPPLISLISAIDKIGVEQLVLTVGDEKLCSKSFNNVVNTRFVFLAKEQQSLPTFSKLSHLLSIRKKILKIIDSNYDNNTVLWIVDEISLKYIGKKIFNYEYILHLMELRERLVYSNKIRKKIVDEHKLGLSALSVVTCEYNRAHITRCLWNLKELPYVLPNKPSYDYNVEKSSCTIHSEEAKKVLNVISNKKIIIYQGICTKERPLDSFIKAVSQLGSEYAFLLVSSNNPYEGIDSDNYYYVPFVQPPFHLELTSHAFIGVLSYTHDSLNTLYCAPNKIWEYSKFGIPMIGSDLPSLFYQFSLYGMGECIKDDSIESIVEAIKVIDNNYEQYSKGAYAFHNSVDFDKIVDKIVEQSFMKRK